MSVPHTGVAWCKAAEQRGWNQSGLTQAKAGQGSVCLTWLERPDACLGPRQWQLHIKKSKEDLYPEITPEAQRVNHRNCDKTKPRISFKFKDRLFPSPLPPSLGSALGTVSAQQTTTHPSHGPCASSHGPQRPEHHSHPQEAVTRGESLKSLWGFFVPLVNLPSLLHR